MKPHNPNVPKGKYALFQTELKTGIVLTLEGRWLQEDAEWYIIFTSLDEAKLHANGVVIKHPEFECIIQDDQNRQVEAIRNESHVQAVREKVKKAREQKRKWWKFW